MPLRLSSLRRSSRPQVHTSGLLGENRQRTATGTAITNPDESPSNSFALPPPSTGETESVHESAEQRMAAYLELGNQVRLLVREATRKRLKDVDHEANNRVLNFVRLRNCEVVVEELCKILCEKLSSSYIHKQWLAVKLVDRLFTACPTMFGNRKDMIVREVTNVYRRSNNLLCSKSQKCKIEASCLIQKMTGNIVSPHSGFMGGNGMVASLVQQPDGNGVMFVPSHATGGGFPRANSSPREQHFGIPIASVAHATNPEAGHYVATAQPQARVDTTALRRDILDKAQMALQHADILQELLCNFSTGETVPSEQEDTLEMLSDLSQQSKDLLESMNDIILKCQEHIEAPGISEAVGESTLALDRLRESLDLYEDVSHSIKMQMGTSGRSSEGPPTTASADVAGNYGTNREAPPSNRPMPPSATPVPPPTSVTPLSSRVDTNPFRRLTRDKEEALVLGHKGSERRSLRASTSRVSGSGSSCSGASTAVPKPKPPSPALLIDLDNLEGRGPQPGPEPVAESSTPSAELNKSKEMQQLESLFDTMDLLTSGPTTSSDNNVTKAHAHPFDNPA